MAYISTDRVTVLLLSPPGLEQKSLYTSLNAVPAAAVIARVADLEAALKITQLRKPDVLVVDVTFLTDEVEPFIARFKELQPHLTLVALVATSTQKSRWSKGRIDFVVEYYKLNQEFSKIVRRVQHDIQARLEPS